VERPATPELPVPPALSQPQQAALVLLQRLLRGRAAQNIMYEGRVRRQELIDELRLSERLGADGAQLDGKFIRRPEARDAATLRLDALLGSTVSEVCAVLSEADPSKREVLIAALDTSHAHAAAAAAVAPTELSTAASITAAAAERSSTSSLPSVPPPAPSLQEAALNLEALGITREQAEEAATRIQAAFHGYHARKEVAAMRARGAMLRRIMADGDEGKVIKCQAAVRGYLDRKHVRAMRASPVAGHAAAVAPKEDEGREGLEKGEEQEERQRQSDFVFDPSSYDSEQVAAATRIQAVMRQRFAQRRVAVLRAAKVSEAVQAEAITADDNETLPPPQLNPEFTVEQQVAVIKIQAARRGYLARRRVAEMRLEQQTAAAEGAEPRRPKAIGRQGDVEPSDGIGGELAEEAETAAAEAAGEDAVWPKLQNLPGFVLTPAAPSGGTIEPLPELATAGTEAEASLMGGSAEDGVVPAVAPAEAMPEEEPSLAVGSSGGGDGDEPRTEASVVANGDDEAVAAQDGEEAGGGEGEGEERQGEEDGEGEERGAAEASQVGPSEADEGGVYEEGSAKGEPQAGETEEGVNPTGEEGEGGGEFGDDGGEGEGGEGEGGEGEDQGEDGDLAEDEGQEEPQDD
ncbi:hypothetical protein Vretifemale_12354, partial [Volvox reticuliferus]